MSDVSVLPPAIGAYLHGFVVRGRRLAVLRGIGQWAAVFLGSALLCCIADRLIQIPPWGRLLLLAGGCIGSSVFLLRPLGLMFRRDADWIAVAQRLERQDPRFEQRLITITSRLLGRPENRGSDEILDHLVYELDQQIAGKHADHLLPLRPVVRWWLLAGGVLLMAVGLARIPEMGFSQLAARYFAPLAGVAPVTTTRLRVVPGDRDIVQSTPLQIDVDAARLSDGQTWLMLSEDLGQTWSRLAMTPTGEDRFSFLIPSVDRDLRYYVTGGDASSPIYLVRVLRPPAVAEFHIRYVYPSYTGTPPLMVTNADGVIEAPVGTDVTLSITATEPLQSALLTMGGEKILMSRADADNTRQARFTVARDGRYHLDLISTREQTGSGPPSTRIYALPDHPPSARLLQPTGDLRLSPGDVLPISYEALDDFGVDSVSVRAQIGADAPFDVPISLFSEGADPAGGSATPQPARPPSRRRVGVFSLDLATMPLSVGDILTARLSVRDTAGNISLSAPLRVLISPRSLDLIAYERIGELDAARHGAETVIAEMDAATAALTEAGTAKRDAGAVHISLARMNRRLAGAAEAATTVRRALLRATAHSDSPQLSIALAGWIDAAQHQAAWADALFRAAISAPAERAASEQAFEQMLRSARALRNDLQIAADGARAVALRLDRENIAVIQKVPVPSDAKVAQMRRLAIQRASEQIADGIKRVGLAPDAPDLAEQLTVRINAARAMVQSRQSIDFAEVARGWSRHQDRGSFAPIGLGERLTTAAEAEAVRADADFSRARDLHLAARAAAALELSAEAHPSKPEPELARYPVAFSAVQREHQLARSAPNPPAPADALRVHQDAAQARKEMARWANSEHRNPAEARAGRAESLALSANIDSEQRCYADADRLDRELFKQLLPPVAGPGNATPAPVASPQAADVRQSERGVQRAMALAREVDRVWAIQKQLITETAATQGRPGNISTLAARQGQVADRIAGVQRDDVLPTAALQPGWRDRAAGAIVRAQSRLALLPRQVSAVADAQSALQGASARALAALGNAQSAPPDQRDAADAAAAQTERDVADAEQRVSQALASIPPSLGESLAASLEPFSPDAGSAAAILKTELVPALKLLADASQSSGPLDQATSAVRQAVIAAQHELSAADSALIGRDPLVAAKWYARAAADALAYKPPDFATARQRQQQTSDALSQAWEDAIHRAASQRVSIVPPLRAIFSDPTIPQTAAVFSDANPPLVTSPYQWHPMLPDDRDGMAAGPHESDPVEYEAALKAYFEALNTVRGARR